MPDGNQPLVISVLDRLLEGNRPVPNRAGAPSLNEVKRAVQRDLQNLLNTRWRCKAWPPSFEELEQSLVNYGIPDFTGMKFTSRSDQESLRSVIEDVIRRYEPRFVDVQVMLQEDVGEPLDRMLRFRINALLRAEPQAIRVAFDTTVETSNGDVAIKGRDA